MLKLTVESHYYVIFVFLLHNCSSSLFTVFLQLIFRVSNLSLGEWLCFPRPETLQTVIWKKKKLLHICFKWSSETLENSSSWNFEGCIFAFVLLCSLGADSTTATLQRFDRTLGSFQVQWFLATLFSFAALFWNFERDRLKKRKTVRSWMWRHLISIWCLPLDKVHSNHMLY